MARVGRRGGRDAEGLSCAAGRVKPARPWGASCDTYSCAVEFKHLR